MWVLWVGSSAIFGVYNTRIRAAFNPNIISYYELTIQLCPITAWLDGFLSKLHYITGMWREMWVERLPLATSTTYPYDHSKPTAFHGPSPLKRCRSAISANDAHVHHSANHMLRVTYQLRPSNSEFSHTFSRLHSIAHSTIRPFEETRGIIFSYFYFGFPDLLLFSN